MRNELPPDATIKEWHDEGLTHQQMVDRWYAQSDRLVNKKTFSMRISRRGWAKPQERCPLIPWAVRNEDQHLYDAKMLRRVHQQRRGDALSPHDLSRVAKFLHDLDEQNAVIDYHPDAALPSPFVWVPREWFDEDIIRHPDNKGHTKRPKKKAPRNPRRVVVETDQLDADA